MLTWRDEGEGDRAFLLCLYASTRTAELEGLGWSPEQLDAFLSMQFTAKEAHYRAHHGNAVFSILCVHEERVGRMVIDHGPRDLLLVDIALLPEHRNAGYGSQVLRMIIGRAETDSVPVRLHVDRNNPAVRLYQRFGFEVVDDSGFSLAMMWQPG